MVPLKNWLARGVVLHEYPEMLGEPINTANDEERSDCPAEVCT
jgi:hypothetical protein